MVGKTGVALQYTTLFVPIQGYGQEFSSQQPHLMGYAGGRAGYKHSLLEHTTTGPTSNCSSPSSLHSPITNLVSRNM